MTTFLRTLFMALVLTTSLSEAATLPQSATPCAVPTGLWAYNLASNRATLQWSTATQNALYELQWRVQGATDWNSVETFTNFDYLLIDLTINTTYEWRVRTICGPGQTGDWAMGTPFQTGCPISFGLIVRQISSNHAQLEWAVLANRARYEVEWRSVGAATWQRESLFGGQLPLDGLTNPGTYEWRVQTVCDDGGRSAVVNGPTFQTGCPQPQSLYVEYSSWTRTRVSWQNYDPGARFGLRYRITNAPNWTEVNDLGSAEYTFTNLTVGSTYEWQVRRQCGDGSWTAYSSGSNFTVSCGRPYVTIGGTSPTAAAIRWSQPADFNGPFDVEYGEQGSTSTTTVAGLMGDSYLLNLLPTNRTYQVRVLARCVFDSPGTPSAPVVFTTSCLPPIINYTPTGPNWIAVHWSIPDQTTPHDLQWRAQGAADWNTIANLPTGVHTLENLTPGQPYELRVRRQCTANLYTDYSVVQVVTPACAPPSFGSEQVSATEAEVNWGNGTTGIYQLQWRPVGGGNFQTVNNLSTNRYILTNLQPNTSYEWRVSSVCGANIPPTSYLTRTFSTSCPVPQFLSVNASFVSTVVNLNWSGGGPNASYRVERQMVGEPNWVALPGLVGQQFATLTDLQPARTYQFRVTTVCANGSESTPTVSGTLSLACPVPFFNSIVRRTATSVWIKPPEGTTNAFVSGYEIRWRSTFGEPGEWQSLSVSPGNVFYVNDLTANWPYEYQIRTLCGNAGTSSYGTAFPFNNRCQTPTALFQYPGSITNGSVRIQWMGATTALSEIQYRPLDELPWTTLSTTQSGSYTLTGLNMTSQYEWRVRSLCTDGQWSPYSNPQTISPSNYLTIRAIYNANAEPLSQTSARLTWNPQGNDISSFEIRIRLNRATDWGTITAYNSQSTILTNLQTGRAYEWQVRWVSGAGERGPWVTGQTFGLGCPSIGLSSAFPVAPNSATFTPYSVESWQEPFLVQVRYRAGLSFWESFSTTSTTVVLPNLIPSSTYTVQIQRICANGERSVWVESTLYTGNCAAGIGTNVLNSSTVRFSVTNPGSSAMAVQIRQIGNATWDAPIQITGTYYDLTGLSPGTVYEWRTLRTCTPPGLTNFLSPQQFITRCPSAPNPTITLRTANSVTVNWMPAATPLTVQWRLRNGVTWQSATASGSPFVLSGLQPGQLYALRLRNECNDGLTESGLGPETVFTPSCSAGSYYVPNANIASPTAQSATSNSIQIIWSGGVPDVSFTLRWRAFGQSVWNETPIATTPFVLSGLTGNTTYDWQIRSDCGTDGVAGSAIVSFTTLPDRSGFYTVLPGDWTDPGIWSGALLPTATNPVQVRHAVNVLPTRLSETLRVQFGVGGALRLKPSGKLRIGE